MTIKSILYPFGDKYNFLNNKWWHRLLKVIFYFAITIIFGSLVGSLIVGDPVFTVWNKDPIIWENSFTGVSDQKDYKALATLSEKEAFSKMLKDGLSPERASAALKFAIDKRTSAKNIVGGANTKTILQKFPELERNTDIIGGVDIVWDDQIDRLSTMGGDMVLRGKTFEEIRKSYPEFAHIDNETFKKIRDDISLRGKGIKDILIDYPQLIKKLSMDEFANIVKEKYPEYADRDNRILAEAVLKKYPIYYDRLDTELSQINTNGVFNSIKIMGYYTLNIIVYIFVTLIIYLLLKLIYYKGVMYIIYGDSINK